jgi:hypothetical protein
MDSPDLARLDVLAAVCPIASAEEPVESLHRFRCVPDSVRAHPYSEAWHDAALDGGLDPRWWRGREAGSVGQLLDGHVTSSVHSHAPPCMRERLLHGHLNAPTFCSGPGGARLSRPVDEPPQRARRYQHAAQSAGRSGHRQGSTRSSQLLPERQCCQGGNRLASDNLASDESS